MLFTKPKKLTYQEDFVTKKTIVFLLLAISFLAGQSIVQVKLKNGTTVKGEFIGTYMEHVHLLRGENIDYLDVELKHEEAISISEMILELREEITM